MKLKNRKHSGLLVGTMGKKGNVCNCPYCMSAKHNLLYLIGLEFCKPTDLEKLKVRFKKADAEVFHLWHGLLP